MNGFAAWCVSNAWLVPVLPAVAAVWALLFGRRAAVASRGLAHPSLLPIVATAGSLAIGVGAAYRALANPAVETVRDTVWIPTGGIPITAGIAVSSLSALIACMVAGVALLVQLYSVGYLHGDPRTATYAAWVALFTAAMLLVVLASDLLELYLGWEVMGLCSYLLIGHYRQSRAAGIAAIKAFLTTRIGDLPFLIGIFVLGTAAGSFRIAAVLDVAALPHAAVVTGTLLLLGGVAGKSAQFPLQTWLPDAMAGPTPVSALIHAATMVAAGVYVIARLYPDFAASPVTLDALAAAAALTMVLAALAALVQDDLKRVLAYSTVSQLAYMTGGLAVGGYQPALFHLLTHAAFKALLFLAAGSVIHAVGTNLMSEMGGLWRRMPVTGTAFAVGTLALAGLPPFSGGLSKDAILEAAANATRGQGGVPVDSFAATAVYAAGLGTVVLTGLYATRMLTRTFFGPARYRAQVHEAPPSMAIPLVLLTLPAAGLGALALPRALGTWLPAPVVHTTGLGLAVVPLVVGGSLAAVAIAAMLVWHHDQPGRDLVAYFPRWLRLPMLHGFGFDAAYRFGVAGPVRLLARLVAGADRELLDGTVNGIGRGARLTGGMLRLAHRGGPQAYAAMVMTGVALAVLAVLVP